MNAHARYEQTIRSLLLTTLPMAPAPIHRPVYRPLFLYAEMLAGKPIATPPLDPLPESLPATNGAAIAESTWRALIHRSRPTFVRLLELQRPNGSFLTPTAKDNLESLWYHELVILHAFTAYAMHIGDSDLLDAAKRAAAYHLNETQPDHATTEPWAINAFLLHSDTWPLADQQLHALQTHHPRGIDAVSAILLTDVVESLAPR